MRSLLFISFLMIAGGLLLGNSPAVAETPNTESEKIIDALFQKMDKGEFLEVITDIDKTLFEETPNQSANSIWIKAESKNDLLTLLRMRNQSLVNLNRSSEIDDFMTKFETVYASSWRALQAAALEWQNVPSIGRVVAGKFYRGNQQRNGKLASSAERDRIHACQLMEKCVPLVTAEEDSVESGWFFLHLADFILTGRNGNLSSWELQDLTDWSELPEADTENPYSHGRRNSQVQGTPMTEDGTPLTFSLPESLEKAANDGERWRWALEQAVRLNQGNFIEETPKTPKFNLEKAFRDEVTLRLAQFYQKQFGEQTLQNIWNQFDPETNDELKREGSLLALETLSDSQTIARTAAGIQRFTMPEDANYILLYQKLASVEGLYQKFALGHLAHISKNRRQYEKAVDYFELREKTEHPPIPSKYCNLPNPYSFDMIEDLREQITGNWGRFEPLPQQTSEDPKVTIRFRNARKAKFTAIRVDLEKLNAKLKKEIREEAERGIGSPKERNIKFPHFSPEWITNSILMEDSQEFLTDEKTEWETALEPLPKFRDSKLTTPLKVNGPGAWLVEMQLENGNRSFIMAWIFDTVLVQKDLDGKKFYFVMDSRTGKPIPGAILDFTGYRIEWLDSKDRRRGRQLRVHSKDFQAIADSNGIWVSTPELIEDFTWQISIRRPGSARIETFTGTSSSHGYFPRAWIEAYTQLTAFGVTDRPIYRPEQKVQFKFWTARAAYELGNYLGIGKNASTRQSLEINRIKQYGEYHTGPLSNQEMKVQIHDPNGEIIYEQKVQTNEFGAVSGDFKLPKDARLGQYQIQLLGQTDNKDLWSFGIVTFRMEEYRKPEFEVKIDAPQEQVKLGGQIKVNIQAKYYFGAPVTNGTVKYRVFRQSHSQRWYAPAPWDWLYGPAYWWHTENYSWFPGWRRWGCPAPIPAWGINHASDEELVLENEIKLTPEMEGKAEVTIDTSLAAALYPDRDHQYRIEANVVDASRREITGKGTILAARTPFKVNVWSMRGFLNVGDQIPIRFAAKTLDGKGVEGDGIVKVFEISYEKDGTPNEKEIHSAKLSTDSEGLASFNLKADHPGQFRVAYLLTSKGKEPETVEGAMIFSVHGNESLGENLRFNDLELIPDKAEYQPGENVRLLINVNQENSTVILFERCVNGVCSSPKIIPMKGKSQIVEFPVRGCDQPNFFIEAFVTARSQVYAVTKEICVPPQERILHLEIIPSKERFLPGETAKAVLKLTDQNGKPFMGETILTVYDKSLEYLSGGSNVGNIYSHFWGWKRHHHPVTHSTTNLKGSNWKKLGDEQMSILNAFFALPLNTGGKGFMMFDLALTNHMRGYAGASGNGITAFSSERRLRKSAASIRMEAPAAMAAPAALTEEAALPSAPVAAAGMNGMLAASPDTDSKPKSKEEKTGAQVPDTLKPNEAHTGKDGNLAETQIRRNFADTAFWTAALKTDENGLASVEFPMPENLTTWKVCAWAMGEKTNVGKAETEIITAKNLILRMQTPRFMTTSDEIFLSANVHNYLTSEKTVKISISLPENAPCRLLETSPKIITAKIPPQGETRVDWVVRAENEGECSVTMTAQTDEESDAMCLSVPVQIHGMAKQNAQSGMIGADEGLKEKANDASEAKSENDVKNVETNGKKLPKTENLPNADHQSAPIASGFMDFSIPEARRVHDSVLEIRFSPTLAGAMLDALPYLADYPYGCTEQTLNRFLPAVLVRKTLNDSGIKLSEIAKKTNNLNAQEIGEAEERNAQWEKQLPNRSEEPVFNEKKLNDMVSTGVDRLINMQCADGGWGWFSGMGETSSAHLTALITRGLLLAQRAEIFGKYENSNAVSKAISSALLWLQKYQRKEIEYLLLGEELEKYRSNEENAKINELPEKFKNRPLKNRVDEMDVLVFAALAEAGIRSSEMDQMGSFIFRDRIQLSPQANALAGIAFHQREETKRFQTILKYLTQFLVTDEENQTAHLSLPNFCFWWCWYGNDIETQAAYLRLLCLDGRKESLHRAAYLVKYLLNHRKNAVYWNSTRDTALVLEAFTRYLRATNELSPQMTVEILLDGELRKTVEITPENLFTADLSFRLKGEDVTGGSHRVELRRRGTGPLYFNGYARYFTLEDFITKSGLEVKVNRKYFLLKPVESTKNAADSHGQLVKQKVLDYERIPLENGAKVTSGDLVEVELTIESKNDYSYLLIEDMKPAGFETENQQSGYDGNPMGAYVEYRDDRTAFFVRSLNEGIHSLSYRLKAETPGKISALPAKIEAMYAPELKGNSDEMKIECQDKKD